MTRVFLSYRRSDSTDITGRLDDRLAAQFGRENVFKDVDSIEAGADFIATIEEAIPGCHTLLAVIGGDWVAVDDELGAPRIRQEGDPVRIELELALRHDVPVIPLLLAGAGMPSTEDLPDSLRELPFRNALPLRPDPHFHGDVDRVVRACRRLGRGPGSRLRNGALAVLLLVLVAAVAYGLWGRGDPAPETPELAVDIAAITANNEWGEPQMAEQDIPPDRDVLYRARLEDGISRVTYDLAYRDLVRRGGPVRGVTYLGSPFRWRFPKLSVKVVNRSEETVVLSHALLRIESSEIDFEPLPVFEDLPVNKLVIHNEGWGPLVEPVATFTITKPQGEDEVSLFKPDTQTVRMKTFHDVGEIALEKLVPRPLRDSSVVTVRGTLAHGAAGNRTELGFETRVSLQIRSAVGMPPTRSYDVMLRAGEAGVVEQVALAQEIPPGGSDHFVIRLAADRSCRTRVSIGLRTVDGRVLEGGTLELDLFVARTTGKLTPNRR